MNTALKALDLTIGPAGDSVPFQLTVVGPAASRLWWRVLCHRHEKVIIVRRRLLAAVGASCGATRLFYRGALMEDGAPLHAYGLSETTVVSTHQRTSLEMAQTSPHAEPFADFVATDSAVAHDTSLAGDLQSPQRRQRPATAGGGGAAAVRSVQKAELGRNPRWSMSRPRRPPSTLAPCFGKPERPPQKGIRTRKEAATTRPLSSRLDQSLDATNTSEMNTTRDASKATVSFGTRGQKERSLVGHTCAGVQEDEEESRLDVLKKSQVQSDLSRAYAGHRAVCQSGSCLACRLRRVATQLQQTEGETHLSDVRARQARIEAADERKRERLAALIHLNTEETAEKAMAHLATVTSEEEAKVLRDRELQVKARLDADEHERRMREMKPPRQSPAVTAAATALRAGVSPAAIEGFFGLNKAQVSIIAPGGAGVPDSPGAAMAPVDRSPGRMSPPRLNITEVSRLSDVDIQELLIKWDVRKAPTATSAAAVPLSATLAAPGGRETPQTPVVAPAGTVPASGAAAVKVSSAGASPSQLDATVKLDGAPPGTPQHSSTSCVDEAVQVSEPPLAVSVIPEQKTSIIATTAELVTAGASDGSRFASGSPISVAGGSGVPGAVASSARGLAVPMVGASASETPALSLHGSPQRAGPGGETPATPGQAVPNRTSEKHTMMATTAATPEVSRLPDVMRYHEQMLRASLHKIQTTPVDARGLPHRLVATPAVPLDLDMFVR